MSRRRQDAPPPGELPLLGGLTEEEGAHPAPAPAGAPGRPPRRTHRVRTLVVLVLAVAVVAAAGAAGWAFLRPIVADLTADTDYDGPGSGQVTIQVQDGETGTEIAETLAESNVVKTSEAFVDALAADPRGSAIQPGTYQLREEMSADGALGLLLDPASRVEERVQLIEGLRAEAALQQISEATRIPVDQLEAAATDPAVGLPAEAGGKLEGYLFPATYQFQPDATAVDVIGAMVGRTKQALQASGTPRDRWHRTLTIASLVEAEASRSQDRPKVARVIENRLAAGMPLQFDTTVDYATGKRGVTTTDADRATDSPYNTYVNAGLPPGPINSPGENAIAAAAHPADGPWMYFVAVNPDTGETKFATTFAEHQRNVKQFQQWLRENGD